MKRAFLYSNNQFYSQTIYKDVRSFQKALKKPQLEDKLVHDIQQT